ncbi:hypothetical protein LMH87_003105 [Akanthomyces muscarius]|uniref:Uncharacterized protein n=1 Tax=Akanthomyces muscarius TaxID=2231603 RepID=A0A9W8Q149_AKAMU|nr:hypothetical protein LMH87_003105 [Akanthomyces muscarius]KAJ4144215.1 hypothetical protein LMH87_003105 [Akanthomyces muscarius]
MLLEFLFNIPSGRKRLPIGELVKQVPVRNGQMICSQPAPPATGADQYEQHAPRRLAPLSVARECRDSSGSMVCDRVRHHRLQASPGHKSVLVAAARDCVAPFS